MLNKTGLSKTPLNFAKNLSALLIKETLGFTAYSHAHASIQLV